MNILVIGEYLTSHAGGAEKSTLSIVKDLFERGDAVTILCAKQTKFKPSRQFLELPDEIKIHYSDVVNTKFPPFLRYGFTRLVYDTPMNINFDSFDKIVVYDLWGKALIAKHLVPNLLSKVQLCIRSEVDYLVYRNYQSGWKFFLWYIRYILQLPFFMQYCRDTIKMAKHSDVVSNSTFVQMRVQQKLGTSSAVKLPAIDIEALKRGFKHKPDFVVFIGDSKHKGLDILYQLILAFPELKFKCIARNPPKKIRHFKNVTISDWVEDPVKIYNEAKLVIVPSQWEEAFGRVAREAYDLGVPVLCSRVGGLVEAVRYDADSLVDNYKSWTAWKLCIKYKISKTS